MSEVTKEIVGRFIDAAVKDQTSARAILREHREVLEGRWLHNETPLHFLAVEGFEGAVRFLAELGANVNATNEFGDTALVDVAVLSGSDRTQGQTYDRITAILLEHGANPNAMSVTRDDVLDIAVTSENAWLVDRLLAAGACPQRVSPFAPALGVWSHRRVCRMGDGIRLAPRINPNGDVHQTWPRA